jgi:hypothetical protein
LSVCYGKPFIAPPPHATISDLLSTGDPQDQQQVYRALVLWAVGSKRVFIFLCCW